MAFGFGLWLFQWVSTCTSVIPSVSVFFNITLFQTSRKKVKQAVSNMGCGLKIQTTEIFGMGLITITKGKDENADILLSLEEE